MNRIVIVIGEDQTIKEICSDEPIEAYLMGNHYFTPTNITRIVNVGEPHVVDKIGDGAWEGAQDILDALGKKADYEPATGHLDEAVDHPAHYGGADNPYEAIKVIEAWGLGFRLGSLLKYIARAGKKGSAVEDLRKGAWYLNREIKALSEEEGA